MRLARIGPLLLMEGLSFAQTVIPENSGRLAAMLYSGETTAVRTNLVLPTPGWANTFSLPGTNAGMTRAEAAITWKGSLAFDAAHRIDYTQTLRQEPGKAIFALDYTAAGDLATECLYLRIYLLLSDFFSVSVRYDDRSTTLPLVQPANVNLLGAKTAAIAAAGTVNALNWTARFDRALFVNLQDKSNESPRAFTF